MNNFRAHALFYLNCLSFKDLIILKMSNQSEHNKNLVMKDSKELMAIYKKNGSFDQRRRELLERFKKSETHSNLLLKLKLMVENKVKQDPTILTKNKGKMAALVQGEIISQHNMDDRNSLLSIVEKDIQEQIIDSPDFHNSLRFELRDIKRKHEGISDEEFQEMLKNEEEKKPKTTVESFRIQKPTSRLAQISRFDYNIKSKNNGSHGKTNDKGEKKDFKLMY